MKDEDYSPEHLEILRPTPLGSARVSRALCGVSPQSVGIDQPRLTQLISERGLDDCWAKVAQEN